MSGLDINITPKPQKSVWLNWYGEKSGDGCPGACNYNTREEADQSSWEGRTHVIQIITENGKPVDVKFHEAKK